MAVMDALLGWLLYLPRDAALVALGLATAGLLILSRRLMTNQDLLRRCREDRARLKALVREAKGMHRETVQTGEPTESLLARLRTTQNQVALKMLRAECRPLLAALVPLALIGYWGFHRFEFHPLRPDEPVSVTATFLQSAAGEPVHIVPQQGVEPEGRTGWLRFAAASNGTEPTASWKLRVTPRRTPYTLEIRHGARTYPVRLRLDGRFYEPPVTTYDGGALVSARVELREFRLFGLVPGVRQLGLPPWVIAYLLVTIPATALLRRLLGVC